MIATRSFESASASLLGWKHRGPASVCHRGDGVSRLVENVETDDDTAMVKAACPGFGKTEAPRCFLYRATEPASDATAWPDDCGRPNDSAYMMLMIKWLAFFAN